MNMTFMFYVMVEYLKQQLMSTHLNRQSMHIITQLIYLKVFFEEGESLIASNYYVHMNMHGMSLEDDLNLVKKV